MKKLIVIATLLFAVPSFASYLIEPYVGYDTGSSNTNLNNSKQTITGTDLGARLGYQFAMVFVAADASFAHNTSKDSSSIKDKNSDASYAADVGFSSIIGIRAWAGYIFKDRIVDHTTPATYDGTGFKVGIGYKFSMIPVAVNFEYLTTTYKSYNGTKFSDIPTFVAANLTSITAKDYRFTVSFPFNFL